MKTSKAADIMTTTVITAKREMRLTDVIKILLRWGISGAPVVDDDGRLVGLINEHDIMNFAFSGNAADTTVAEAMTKDVVTFTPETDVETIVQCCASRHIRQIPIVRDGKVVGIVSRRDILREMDRLYGEY
jgi:CBS domain-containing protein